MRALETIPSLSIHYGHFITRPASRLLVNPTKRQKYADVWITDEKSSDVGALVL